MKQEKSRTYEATIALLKKSRNNENAVEKYLANTGKATTTEVAKAMGWSVNKTNSTIYRMKEKELIEFEHIEQNHRIVKQIQLAPEQSYFK